MKTVLLVLFFAIKLLPQEIETADPDYKPKNLNEAISQLDVIYPDSTKQKIMGMTENEFVGITHFTTGLWIRNEWLYNRSLDFNTGESELRKSLDTLGLPSNDDMSSLILRSYYRHLTNQEINLKQQIKDIYQFYININNPVWIAAQEKKYWDDLMNSYSIGDTITNQIYYDRSWFGMGACQKNTLVTAVVSSKREKEIGISIISFGDETDKSLIFDELNCNEDSCYVNPIYWKNISKK